VAVVSKDPDWNALPAAAVTERDGTLVLGVPQKLFAIRTQGTVPNQPHNFEVADNGQTLQG